ncbi:replication protein [Paenibacillus validus]|uniref:replication protein n=1 Tax=Paenibacillus validus TaxID=44253 RepID=UPI002E22944E|nr:replication protein [Paenibacillus validus]MED4602557.1 replication protein [Paenibacillus validus]MED4606082.1 replication protein [Paenibacillus validus]
MSEPQKKKTSFIITEMNIYDQLFSRKLTERQQKIVKFIHRLSNGCQRESAYIPKLKYFELCGVRIQDTKKELSVLRDSNVIHWDGDHNYSLNPNYSEWDINYVGGWDQEAFEELLHLNLKGVVTKSVNESKEGVYEKSNFYDDDSYEKSNSEVTKSVNESKEGVYEKSNFYDDDSYEKSNSEVTKSVNDELRKVEVEEGANPCGSKAEQVSIDSIIYSNIDNKKIINNNSSSRSKKTTYSEDNQYYQMAVYFYEKVKEAAYANNKGHLVENADLQKWADEFRKIVELDKRDALELKDVIDWATADPFWQINILSPAKLRKQYVQLAMKMDQKPSASSSGRKRVSRFERNKELLLNGKPADYSMNLGRREINDEHE